MNQDWVLQTNETRRTFANATWVPLRASFNDEQGQTGVTEVGYVSELRKLSTHAKKDELGSNKLLQDVLAQKVGADKARLIFGVVAGAYDMRVGDAHPTSTKIRDAIKLAKIDESNSFLKQGEQLISNFGQSVWWIGKLLFG